MSARVRCDDENSVQQLHKKLQFKTSHGSPGSNILSQRWRELSSKMNLCPTAINNPEKSDCGNCLQRSLQMTTYSHAFSGTAVLGLARRWFIITAFIGYKNCQSHFMVSSKRNQTGVHMNIIICKHNYRQPSHTIIFMSTALFALLDLCMARVYNKLL